MCSCYASHNKECFLIFMLPNPHCSTGMLERVAARHPALLVQLLHLLLEDSRLCDLLHGALLASGGPGSGGSNAGGPGPGAAPAEGVGNAGNPAGHAPEAAAPPQGCEDPVEGMDAEVKGAGLAAARREGSTGPSDAQRCETAHASFWKHVQTSARPDRHFGLSCGVSSEEAGQLQPPPGRVQRRKALMPLLAMRFGLLRPQHSYVDPKTRPSLQVAGCVAAAGGAAGLPGTATTTAAARDGAAAHGPAQQPAWRVCRRTTCHSQHC